MKNVVIALVVAGVLGFGSYALYQKQIAGGKTLEQEAVTVAQGYAKAQKEYKEANGRYKFSVVDIYKPSEKRVKFVENPTGLPKEIDRLLASNELPNVTSSSYQVLFYYYESGEPVVWVLNDQNHFDQIHPDPLAN